MSKKLRRNCQSFSGFSTCTVGVWSMNHDESRYIKIHVIMRSLSGINIFSISHDFNNNRNIAQHYS